MGFAPVAAFVLTARCRSCHGNGGAIVLIGPAAKPFVHETGAGYSPFSERCIIPYKVEFRQIDYRRIITS
jgi:hypothetical protein